MGCHCGHCVTRWNDLTAAWMAEELVEEDVDSCEIHEYAPNTSLQEAPKTSPVTTYQHQGDAPICTQCGAITVRSGACYTCTQCGASSGCG